MLRVTNPSSFDGSRTAPSRGLLFRVYLDGIPKTRNPCNAVVTSSSQIDIYTMLTGMYSTGRNTTKIEDKVEGWGDVFNFALTMCFRCIPITFFYALADGSESLRKLSTIPVKTNYELLFYLDPVVLDFRYLYTISPLTGCLATRE